MSMTRRCRALAWAAVVVAAALVARADAVAECCSSCIGKTAETVYDYDPISYEQCSIKTFGARVCCFECGTWGEPTYGESIDYASDGTTPTIKTGKWVSLQWSQAAKVTYITLKDGQKKTVTPTLNDTAATVTSGYYMICARSKGSIVFRGWGTDACRGASPEKTIQVLEGDAGATCDAAAPTAPTVTKGANSASSSQSEDPDIKNCNLNRASIKEVDGKQQCVCVNEWSGAPACDQMPTWKWIITIGGGIAALFSIVISVRAFLNSRKKKNAEEDEGNTTPVGAAKDDVEILRIGADRPSAHATPQQTAYKRDFDGHHDVYKMNDQQPEKRGYDDKHGVYKMNDREFSL